VVRWLRWVQQARRAQGTLLSQGQQPNELWSTDYKGEFLLGNRQYCYPLTVTDHASRFLLCCEALSSTCMPWQDALPDVKTSCVAGGQLVAAAAHELKNPMEAMTTLLYLLQQNPTLDHAGLKHVALLRDELERMRIVVAQTLGLYRESARPEGVQVSGVLDANVGFYAHKIRYQEIAVQKRYGCSGIIEAVPGEIRQVFYEPCGECVGSGSTGGQVNLHNSACRWGDPSRGGVRVTIADNGPGILPDHRQAIFTPFFTTKGDKGSGLGLSVSKGIVEK
jgi:signal transduction histidine kinase